MILVDTSVWIEFLNRKEPYCSYLLHLLEHNEVMASEPVFAELLQGASGPSETRLLMTYFTSLPKPKIENLLLQAGLQSGRERWFSKGLGIMDASILLSALITETPLWSLDKNLVKQTPKKLVHDPKLL